MRESTLQTIEDIVANVVDRRFNQLEKTLGGLAGQLVRIEGDTDARLDGIRLALDDIHEDVHGTIPVERSTVPNAPAVRVPVEHIDKPSPRIIPTIVLAADNDPVLIEELLRGLSRDAELGHNEAQAVITYDHPSKGVQTRRVSGPIYQDRGGSDAGDFVTVHDHDSGEPRNFRLDRILDVQVTRPAAGLVQL